MDVFVRIGNQIDYNRLLGRTPARADVPYMACDSPEFRLKGIRLLLYKLHNSPRFGHLPFRSVWARELISPEVRRALNRDSEVCFIFGDRGFLYQKEMHAFDYLRKTYPRCRIVFLFSDRIELYTSNYSAQFDLDTLRRQTDLLISYNVSDVKKYGFVCDRPMVKDFDFVEDDPSVEAVDIFFVGLPKGRLEQIYAVYDRASALGLKCGFYLAGVPAEERRTADGLHYIDRMPYAESLRHAKRAVCILNLIQPGADGLTLRDYEAIGMNKVLLTNGSAILRSAFYTESKLIRVDELEKDVEKIRTFSASVPWNGREEYSAKAYYAWLDGELRAAEEGKEHLS